jgi:ATP-binding cassette, subfamily B, bacterial
LTDAKTISFFEGVKLRDLHRAYRAFVPHLRKYRRLFVLTYLALFASMLMSLLKPWPLKIILDHIILDKAVPRRLEFLNSIVGHEKVILLAILCAGMVAIFLLEGLFTFIRKYFVEAAGERAINDIRQEVFGNLQTSELRTDRPGDLIVRLTSDAAP